MAKGQTPLGVDVTTESDAILAANPARQWAVVVNDSDTVIYLALDADAIVNAGIRLNANGGSVVISKEGDMFSNGPINAIHGGSGNKVACVQEAV